MKNFPKDFLNTLLKLDTSLGQSANQVAALDLISKHLPAGFSQERFVVDGVSSAFFYSGQKESIDVLVCTHIDVVPGSEKIFEAKVEGDKLRARGAFDMKGPLVASLQGIHKYLAESKAPLTIGILVTSDEEQGGFKGTKEFIARFPGVRPSVVLVPDGGNSYSIVTEQKGVINLEVSFEGRSAHSARPWEGSNAAARAAHFISELNKRFPDGTASDWQTTAVVTSLKTSSLADNTVANGAQIRLNIRAIADDVPQEIIDFCRHIDSNATCKVLLNEPALRIDPGHYALQLMGETVMGVTGNKPVFERYPSTSDARYFGLADQAVVILRPPGGEAHGGGEWVSVSGLEMFASLIERYLYALERNKDLANKHSN